MWYLLSSFNHNCYPSYWNEAARFETTFTNIYCNNFNGNAMYHRVHPTVNWIYCNDMQIFRHDSWSYCILWEICRYASTNNKQESMIYFGQDTQYQWLPARLQKLHSQRTEITTVLHKSSKPSTWLSISNKLHIMPSLDISIINYHGYSGQADEETFTLPVIWDTMTFIWCHCNGIWVFIG